jgi:phosphatidylserine/phosphatidylglycerophosphate/cardiolipin synthase-like enzyme
MTKNPENLLQFLETNLSNNETTILSKMKEIIDGAEKSIYICSWLINSKPISDAIIAAANRLHGHVYLVSALDQNYLHAIHLENDEDLDLMNSYNFESLSQMAGNNDLHAAVDIHGQKNAHAKFVIVDEKVAVITSANFTHSSLEVTGERKFHKNEIGILIKKPILVKSLSYLFKCAYLTYHDAHHQFFDSPIINSQLYFSQVPDFLRLLSKFHYPENFMDKLIWTLPDNFANQFVSRTSTETAILDLINANPPWIKILSYKWIVPLDSALGKALKDYLLVKTHSVTVILNRIPEEFIDNGLMDFIRRFSNLKVYFHPHLHAKTIFTPNSWIMTTANIDYTYGLRNNFEVGIQSSNSKINANISQYFEQILNGSQKYQPKK